MKSNMYRFKLFEYKPNLFNFNFCSCSSVPPVEGRRGTNNYCSGVLPVEGRRGDVFYSLEIDAE